MIDKRWHLSPGQPESSQPARWRSVNPALIGFTFHCCIEAATSACRRPLLCAADHLTLMATSDDGRWLRSAPRGNLGTVSELRGDVMGWRDGVTSRGGVFLAPSYLRNCWAGLQNSNGVRPCIKTVQRKLILLTSGHWWRYRSGQVKKCLLYFVSRTISWIWRSNCVK